MTAEAARDVFRSWAKRLPRRAENTVHNTLDDAYATARKYSSGTLSPADLARMGRPFARARRANQAGLTFGIINKDSGDFFGAWRQAGPEERRGGVEASIFNVSNHARYLYDPDASDFADFGTRYMFGRNLPELVIRDVTPRFWRRSEETLWP